MNYSGWAIALICVAVVLFLAELFIPSGGLIGFAAAGTLVAGIVLLFKVDTTLGLISATVVVALAPIVFAFVMRIWPNTPIARRLILHAPRSQAGADDEQDADDEELAPLRVVDAGNAALVNREGEVITDLRPAGTVLIDGNRVECLAESGMIRAGQRVRVVAVDGMQVKVRSVI